jgi:hypothetical protein
MPTPSIADLRRAIELSEQIAKLEAELESVLNWSSSGKPTGQSPRRGRPPGKMSADARAKIAAAQKARWAKVKGAAAEPTVAEQKTRKKKRKLSPESRARIVAAVKARWARQKKAK